MMLKITLNEDAMKNGEFTDIVYVETKTLRRLIKTTNGLLLFTMKLKVYEELTEESEDIRN